MLSRNWIIGASITAIAAGGVLVAAALAQNAPAENMSFFVTSAGLGDGANLGGLEGADAHCQSLAAAVGAGNRTWRAYLSTTGADGVNAGDRIGAGPWYNAGGVMVAEDLAMLHGDANNINKETALTETGAIVNGRGDNPNMHDILTGTLQDGTAADMTCANWTTNVDDNFTYVGHHDLVGNQAGINFWNYSHQTRGCSQPGLVSTGGAGLFYCFAAD
jgi:hypothetical protein